MRAWSIAMAFPLAHLAHWAALLYAAPLLVLLIWVAGARLARWFRSRRGA